MTIDIPFRLDDGETGLELLGLLIVEVDEYGGIEGWRVQDDSGRPIPMDIPGAKVRQLMERHIAAEERAYA